MDIDLDSEMNIFRIIIYGTIITMVLLLVCLILYKLKQMTYTRTTVIGAPLPNIPPYPISPNMMPLPTQDAISSEFNNSCIIGRYPSNIVIAPPLSQRDSMPEPDYPLYPPTAPYPEMTNQNPPSYEEATVGAYAKQTAYNSELR